MPFFEYEYMLEDIKEIQLKEEKEREKQEKDYNHNSSFKMPKFDTPQMPKISIPKF